MRNIFITLALVFFISNSCKEDFETFDIGKEETVVFGVLNVKDTVHYLKVFKTFVANPDQLEIEIKNENIYYYEPEDIEVSLEQWKNNNYIKTIVFSPTTVDSLSSYLYNDLGFYTSNEWLDADSKYVLKIKHFERDVTTTVELTPYGTRDIEFQFYDTDHRSSAITVFQSDKREKFEYTRDWESNYGEEVVHRFLFLEIFGNDTTPTYIEWNQIPDEYNHFGDIRIGQFKEEFYRYLAEKIPYKSGVKRIALSLDQMILFTDLETQDYIVNAKTPKSDFYSIKSINNVENGIGFVGWQYYWVNFAQRFANITIDSLSMMDSTMHLNFMNSQGQYPNGK